MKNSANPTQAELDANFGYVYEIQNKLTGRIYVGKHEQTVGEDWSSYDGSSKALLADIKLFGRKHFVKALIEFTADAEALKVAEQIHIQAAIKTGHCYNLAAPFGLGDDLSDDQTIRLLVNRLAEKPRTTVEADLKILRDRLYHDSIDLKPYLQRLYEVHLFALALMDERAFLTTSTQRAKSRTFV